MILGIDHLIKAEKAGEMAIENRAEFNPFSLDLHLDKLYRRKEVKASVEDEQSMSQEQFIDEILEEVNIPEEGIVIKPGEFYLWQPREKIFLSRELTGQITSRSGWARLGIRASSESDDTLGRYKEIESVPLCTLVSTGTKVVVKKGDAFSQLFIEYGREYLSKNYIKNIIDSGELVIKKHDVKLKSRDLEFHGDLVLTLNDKIQVYNGTVLIPGEIKEKDFEEVKLSRIDKTFLKKGTFFLSSSAESVEIPSNYVGYVTETNSIMTSSYYFKTRDSRFDPLMYKAHANAPYIGPKDIFTGNIAFENTMKFDGEIFPGMKLSELALITLSHALKEKRKSSFYNQNHKVKRNV